MKNPVPNFIGEPFLSSATISTTAGLALLTISRVVPARADACQSSKHTVVTAKNKFRAMLTFKMPRNRSTLPQEQHFASPASLDLMRGEHLQRIRRN